MLCRSWPNSMAIRLNQLTKTIRKSPYKHKVNGICFTDEGLEQYTVAEWLRAHKIMFLHIPNEARRDRRLGMMLKMLGLEAGASDILIFDSPPKHASLKGVAIEMKTKKGKPTSSQIEWLEKISLRGWSIAICYGADDAISLLKSLGYGG